MHRRPPCRYTFRFQSIRTGHTSTCPVRLSSEGDDAISLLERRRTFQYLIDRAMLQSSHSQINRYSAQHVLGYLLENQVAQLFANDHDFIDAGSAEIAGLETCGASEA